jgi:hypothetical protein
MAWVDFLAPMEALFRSEKLNIFKLQKNFFAVLFVHVRLHMPSDLPEFCPSLSFRLLDGEAISTTVFVAESVENARRNAGLCCYLCSITITSCHLHIL